MFDNKMFSFQDVPGLGNNAAWNNHMQQYNAALDKFKSTLFKGNIFRLIKRVLSRPQKLYDLNALRSGLHLRGSSYSGIQVVLIRSIIGSEGRTADFDMDFNPMGDSVRERWINMALAYLSHIPLPPVQLIQVGNAYFVRDGHHRISVSRAFGQVAIDAEVIAWKASPPFPWQAETAKKRPVFSRPATYPLD